MSESAAKRWRIGYALVPKKVQSIIQPSLVEHARDRGLDLVQIDLDNHLIEQGPFDCVVHKLYGAGWGDQLGEFSLKCPHVPIIDPLHAIEKLHSRITMLKVVKELKIDKEDYSLDIPRQVLVCEKDELLLDLDVYGGLKFPVIAKPMVANGTAGSHRMALVLNNEGLKRVIPPVVLQEFVNHGGVVFKVYVAGKYVKCVKRKSLPDVSEDKLGVSEGLLSFSQISNVASQEESDDIHVKLIEDAVMPISSFVDEVANGLRQALGLHLFNFDMIRDSRDGNRYLVIDINYFPGYAKLPGYEKVLTDFLLDVVHQEQGDTKSLGVGEDP